MSSNLDGNLPNRRFVQMYEDSQMEYIFSLTMRIVKENMHSELKNENFVHLFYPPYQRLDWVCKEIC